MIDSERNFFSFAGRKKLPEVKCLKTKDKKFISILMIAHTR